LPITGLFFAGFPFAIVEGFAGVSPSAHPEHQRLLAELGIDAAQGDSGVTEAPSPQNTQPVPEHSFTP
jgi:hypothetical protein